MKLSTRRRQAPFVLPVASRRRWLRQHLLAWYAANARDFPWRRPVEPFHVLVAEKLLQQTAARSHLVEVFQELVGRFPDAQTLAKANLSTVRGIIKPLGFSFRAAEMQRMARALLRQHGGVVPTAHEELMALPGVGEYISRAVRVFGFGLHDAVVDTNVARLFRRVFGLTGTNEANPARDPALYALALLMCPASMAREYNYAVLDFTARVCLPLNPRCSNCPLKRGCEYVRIQRSVGRHAEGQQVRGSRKAV